MIAEKVHILIVDDEEVLGKGLSRYLSRSNTDLICDTCLEVESALQILHKNPVDLLITDFRMPGRDGLELVKEARRLYHDMPVILMTGYGRPDLKMQALQQGVAYIEKPFKMEAIEELADALTEGRVLKGEPQPQDQAWAEFELADLVQIFGMKRWDRSVYVMHEGKTGAVYLNNGEIQHAETANLSGIPALAAMVTWSSSQITVQHGYQTKEYTIQMSSQNALLEAMKLADESIRDGKPLDAEEDQSFDSMLDNLGVSEANFSGLDGLGEEFDLDKVAALESGQAKVEPTADDLDESKPKPFQESVIDIMTEEDMAEPEETKDQEVSTDPMMRALVETENTMEAMESTSREEMESMETPPVEDTPLPQDPTQHHPAVVWREPTGSETQIAFSTDTCRHQMDGEVCVLHGVAFLARLTHLDEEMPSVPVGDVLRESAEDSFLKLLNACCDEQGLTDPLARLDFAAKYFAIIGMGLVGVADQQVGPNGGRIELNRSRLDMEWVEIYDQALDPINHFGAGYIAAMFACAFGAPARAFKVEEIMGIAMDNEISVFDVERAAEGGAG